VALEHVIANLRWCVLVEEIHGDDARALLAELGGQRAQALLAPRDEHQRGAGLAREPPRGRLADPAGGTGDEHDPRSGCGVRWFCHGLPRCRCS
jgi:hypothetical protein